MKTIPKKEYESNTKILAKLNKIKNTSFITSRISDYDETYDFFVETDSVKVVESIDGTYNSYTFPISKDSNSDKVYNLVFSLNDNQEYESKIVEYDFSGDNSYTVGYADIDLDDNDYLTRGPGTQSFSYQCVTTIHYECGWYQEVNGNSTCMNMNILSSDSSCSYSYTDSGNGSGGSGNGSGSYIWIGGGSGGGSYSSNTPPNTTTTNPDIGSSYNGPSFTKPFLMFFAGLIPEQQSFANNTLGLKFQLQELFDNENPISDDFEEEIINAMMSNPEATFDDFFLDVDSDIEKLIEDIEEELECFDTTMPAQFTIYCEQAIENSRDVTARLGHTFVGIEQNGTTRNIGFYPESSSAVIMGDADSELHDNSTSPFHVSISIEIDATKLGNIITYIKNSPSVYTLGDYNCTDFGIQISSLAGLELPSTVGQGHQFGIKVFEGRNPGDLGEDMRALTLPTGATRNNTGGNAPAREGDCP